MVPEESLTLKRLEEHADALRAALKRGEIATPISSAPSIARAGFHDGFRTGLDMLLTSVRNETDPNLDP